MTFTSGLNHVLHTLRHQPIFSLVVVLTLGAAIGANTAVFSLVDAVLIRPLPFPGSDRLVGVWHTAPAIDMPQFEQADAAYLIYRHKNTVFEEMGIYSTDSVNLAGDQEPVEVDAAFVTPSLFFTLGVNPEIGRIFVESEERPGEEPTVILSYGMWASRYGADPEILGRKVRVDGVPRIVVGVMPAGFHFPSPETLLWLPQVIDPAKAGRTFDRSDLDQPTGAVVVSAALARHYWPDESAIGKRLRPETTLPGAWHRIVGVVGDTYDDLAGEPIQSAYYPLLSRAEPGGNDVGAIRSLNLLIRSGLRPRRLRTTCARRFTRRIRTCRSHECRAWRRSSLNRAPGPRSPSCCSCARRGWPPGRGPWGSQRPFPASPAKRPGRSACGWSLARTGSRSAGWGCGRPSNGL